MDINDLNDRSREIFRLIVDTYLETGEPVGSRTLSRLMGSLSAASIRNVMADLEHEQLLTSPHTSAGRMPTQVGLRFYLDGLMQVGELTLDERADIERLNSSTRFDSAEILALASETLSGLAGGIGMVIAPKTEKPLKLIRLMPLETGRALAVLVFQDGDIENRVVQIDPSLPAHVFDQANNFLNARIQGLTSAEARINLARDLARNRTQLDQMTADLVERGVILDPGSMASSLMIVRGQNRVLSDVQVLEDLEKARHMMEQLEQQDWMLKLLDATREGEGIQIFIGTENQTFRDSAWSVVLSPYRQGNRIVGAIGVIGPSRLNYRRVVPIVDYTAHTISRLLGGLIDADDPATK